MTHAPGPANQGKTHAGSKAPRSLARSLVITATIVTISLPLGLFASLYAVDHGWADRPISSWMSHKLGRTVRFAHLETHLLSSDPTIRIDKLTIGNPSWAGGAALAEVDRVTAKVRLWSLLRGPLDVPALLLERPVLNLVRTASGQKNWVLGHPRPGQLAFAPLQRVGTLIIEDGRMTFRDIPHNGAMRGRFSQSGQSTFPLSVSANGMLRDAGFTLTAIGGRSTGRPSAAPTLSPFGSSMAGRSSMPTEPAGSPSTSIAMTWRSAFVASISPT